MTHLFHYTRPAPGNRTLILTKEVPNVHVKIISPVFTEQEYDFPATSKVKDVLREFCIDPKFDGVIIANGAHTTLNGKLADLAYDGFCYIACVRKSQNV